MMGRDTLSPKHLAQIQIANKNKQNHQTNALFVFGGFFAAADQNNLIVLFVV